MIQSKTNNHLSTINNHCALLASTTVEDSLQISSFLTNKANFLDALMNVCPDITRDYENISNWTLGENKPNSKPIKANFRGKKMLLCMTINPRRVSLCYYADEIEAAKAYDKKAKELFGEFAYLDLPERMELKKWIRKIVGS